MGDGRESHAERGEVAADVAGAEAITIIGVEEASERSSAIAAAPAEPRRGRRYEGYIIPLNCFIEGLTTACSESAAIHIINVVCIDVW